MSAKKQTVKYIIYCLIILGCDLLKMFKVFSLRFGEQGAFCFCL